MNDEKPKLNPNWITGFIDAEGCFTVGIYKNLKNKLNWSVNPSFELVLHEKDLNLLLEIKYYFNNVGSISINKKNNYVIYRIRDLNSLIDLILSHFDKYPLISQKYNDYILFKKIILLLKDKEHLTKEGLIEIVNLKALLNKGLSKEIRDSFPILQNISKARTYLPNSIDNNWLAGFFSGDGCFFIKIIKSESCNLGYSVKLRITITQHSRDEILLKKIAESLNCGIVYKHSKNAIVFSILEFKNVYNIIIPLFKKYSIKGVRLKDFEDFCIVADLIKNKVHLTKKGFEYIKFIKSNMNKGRD